MNVAIIPARGGSKRIPRKNIRPFHGKPIIAYSIEAAKASGLFEHIVVSTDDEEIAQVVLDHGVGVVERPPMLATDAAGTQEVTAHALLIVAAMRGAEIKFGCCIYPCAPLITAEDLRKAYREAHETPYNYVYAEGQFYFGMALRFIEAPNDFSYSLRMESLRYIDINTPEDWSKAEAMYAALHKEAA